MKALYYWVGAGAIIGLPAMLLFIALTGIDHPALGTIFGLAGLVVASPILRRGS